MKTSISSLTFAAFGFALGLGLAAPANAQIQHIVRFDPDGTLDFGLSQDGEILMSNGVLADVVQTSTTTFAVVGSSRRNNVTGFLVERFNDDGTLDSSFGQGGEVFKTWAGADARANAVAQRQGKIYVAGTVQPTNGGLSKAAVVRFNTNGSVDTSFGVAGVVEIVWSGMSSSAQELLVYPQSGKVLVVGGAGDRFGITRVNANGSLDTTFSGDGMARVPFDGTTWAQANGVAVSFGRTEDSGWIAIGGVASSSGSPRAAVTLLTAAGEYYARFNSGGRKTFQFSTGYTWFDNNISMAADTRGRIVLAGTISSQVGFITIGVTRLLETGEGDPSFDGDGFLIPNIAPTGVESVKDLAVTSVGDIAIGGFKRRPSYPPGGPPAFGPFAVRLDPDGTAAEGFNFGYASKVEQYLGHVDVGGVAFVNGDQVMVVGTADLN